MYRLELTNNPDSSFKIKSKDYEFNIDRKGKGIIPSDTFLASIGSCIGLYTKKYLEGVKVSSVDFNITVEAELAKEPS